MNESVRKALKAQTEARAELNALPEDASEEVRQKAIKKLEEADQALLAAIEEPAPEPPEELRHRIELRRYLGAYAEGRGLDGAEAELNQELQLNTDTMVPLAALDPGEREEDRADANPPAAVDAAHIQNAIVRRVFADTMVGFLGVPSPAVGAGVSVYPVLGSAAAAKMKAANADTDAAAYTLATETIKPTRGSARFLLNMEVQATMSGSLEGALRDDLRMQIGILRDTQVLTGDGAGANISGITKLLDQPAAVSAAATAEDYRQLVIGSLDNQYFRRESDVRVLLRLNSYKAGRSLYQDADKTIDAITAMRNLGASAAATTLLAADGTNPKADHCIVTARPADAVAPVWDALTVIRDPYTLAGKGQTALTVHTLFGFAFLRKDGWKQHQLQVRG